MRGFCRKIGLSRSLVSDVATQIELDPIIRLSR